MPAPDKLWSGGDPPRDPLPAHPFHHDPPPADPRPSTPPASGGRGRRRAATALAAVALMGAGALGGAALVGDDDAAQTLPAALPAAPAAKPGESTARAVYAAASPAVVSVRAGGSGGQGTGFLIDAQGTVVTNAHVVGDSRRAQISFGKDRMIDAEILGTDPSTDIAVLKVDASRVRGVRPLALADSDKVVVGDPAVAIGNPFGLDRTATEGIISALGRQITAPNGFGIDDAIQTDAPINPGNSGGPLLNAAGQVVGINSQILTGGSGNGNVGVGFAVPSNTVREVVPRLQRGETISRPYLGLSTGEGPSGATVGEVVPGGPSARAGLRVGDVVKRMDGGRVNEPADVAAAIADRKPGDKVEVVVERGGQEVELSVTLGTRPARTP
jgi:putative serine protease PepD